MGPCACGRQVCHNSQFLRCINVPSRFTISVLAPMELRHLRYFVGVAEALSFTKAADKLHTAQPSLSRQIKDLEEELGVRLLNRTKHRSEERRVGKECRS